MSFKAGMAMDLRYFLLCIFLQNFLLTYRYLILPGVKVHKPYKTSK